MENCQRYFRKQVWWHKSEDYPEAAGVQAGTRPVIIVSNDTNNLFSPTITVVPLTTANKKDLVTHVKFIMNNKESTALCEQLKTVSKESLKTYISTLSDEKMTEIDAAMLKALGFMPTSDKNYEIFEEKEEKEEKIPEITKHIEEHAEKDEKKKYATRFTAEEREEIISYTDTHTLVDATKHFSEIYNLPYDQMYYRICNVKYSKKRC